MESSLALTIIAATLTLLGLFKFLSPKKFNESAMGELHEEAINPAAAIRAALGGLVLSMALIAFMSRNLEQDAMSVEGEQDTEKTPNPMAVAEDSNPRKKREGAQHRSGIRATAGWRARCAVDK